MNAQRNESLRNEQRQTWKGLRQAQAVLAAAQANASLAIENADEYVAQVRAAQVAVEEAQAAVDVFRAKVPSKGVLAEMEGFAKSPKDALVKLSNGDICALFTLEESPLGGYDLRVTTINHRRLVGSCDSDKLNREPLLSAQEILAYRSAWVGRRRAGMSPVYV